VKAQRIAQVGVAAVLLATVGAVIDGLKRGAIYWTGVASVASAVVAVVTLATLAVLINERSDTERALKLALDRDERELADRKRHQAEQVSAWVEVVSIYGVGLEAVVLPWLDRVQFNGTRKNDDAWAVVLGGQNLSDKPVFDVLVRVNQVSDPGPTLNLNAVTQRTAVVRRAASWPPKSVRQREKPEELTPTNPMEPWDRLGADQQARRLRTEMWFTDSAGAHWQRKTDGQLEGPLKRAHQGAGGLADALGDPGGAAELPVAPGPSWRVTDPPTV